MKPMEIKIDGTKVKVIFLPERVSLGVPAKVIVYKGGNLIEEVTAEIVGEMGADGDIYPSVVFKRQSNDLTDRAYNPHNQWRLT